MARTRRNKAAAKRYDAKVARTTQGALPAKRTRLAYHSASKNEITVRTVEYLETGTNKRGETYLRVWDVDKKAKRSLTPARIGWAVAA